MNLGRLLAREQRAYLRRDRRDWSEHLTKARDFFGEGLREADPERPVLILGAGTGLEIPWKLAPRRTTGWDADPWSRLGTALRHRRFPPWVFEDVTGGFQELGATLERAITLPGSLRRRPPERSARRLVGLIPFLRPGAGPLRRWLRSHEPGTILVANLLGQLGCMAERMVESAFLPACPWGQDPDLPDPLADALDAWTARSIQAVCQALLESGASLWLLHDRAVLHGDAPVYLGPLEDSWIQQLRGPAPLELSDPMPGLDLRQSFAARQESRRDRWLWPVAPGQVHLMEALAYSGGSAHSAPAGNQTV
jgi:hypothetical protein